MLVIGLGNKARHGKDSFAQAIENYFLSQRAAAERHGLKYTPVVIQKLAFADALYKEVNEWLKNNPKWAVNGIGTLEEFIPVMKIPEWVKPDPNAEKSLRAPYGKHSKLLQWWGTEYRRAQDPDYWVKAAKAAINPKADIVLITDMRFLNEAAMIKSIGGQTVQVNRKNLDGTPFVDPSRDPNHRSETELDNYNYDFQITVKTGDLALLDEWAITLVHYLRVLMKKGTK